MQQVLWMPEVPLSRQEERMVKKIQIAKLLVFLCHHRHEIFDEQFQEALVRVWTGKKSVGSRQCPQPYERERSFWRRIPVFRMMKSLRRHSWTGGGNSCSIVWIAITPR